MTEQERILALLDEGKINQEEADLLLEALAEADDAEEEALAFAEPDVGRNPQPPPAAPQPPPRAPEPPEGREEAGKETGKDLRWVRAYLTAGEFNVEVDPSLGEPVMEGSGDMRRQGDDFVVNQQAKHPDGGLLGFIGNLKIGEVKLRLPEGYGVDLVSKAGNLNISGAAYFKGRVLAGNVELRKVRGIDLELRAGNLDAELYLSEGEHRVQVAMGNAELVLLRGSSVRVKTHAGMGRVDIRGPSTVGGGRANLDVAVKIGSLEVETPRD